ncbi:flagellar export chaperone FliS [Agaribacter marinus]|uniref:Flagellar secretion chaperone FliS n=1 Tax=Agaribacter marinus TaxID=1431249 RepID=A0AA37SZE3_9ALTE|nr:flagellar export chaperone FliS [Agaribacter marinus]GLR70781.1 flagellar protein FliS [Agaribacter marinus]
MSLRAINAYQKDSLKQRIATADPHQLTLMLMQGALDRLSFAKGAHDRNDVTARAQFISKATAIFINLRDTLDTKAGGEFADNLHDLYDYMIDKLITVNQENTISQLDEVIQLFYPIKEAWQQIPEQDKQLAYAQRQA